MMIRVCCVVTLFTFAVSFAEGPLRIVATGGRMGTSTYGVTGSYTAFRHRTPHMLGGPVDEIQIGFMNWVHDYTKEVANTNEVTIEYAWLERASSGQIVALTFDGERAFVMPANSDQAYFPADPIASSVWTGARPERDEVFWVNVLGRLPQGGKVCMGSPATWPGAKFMVYDPANATEQIDNSGQVLPVPGQISRVLGLPLVFTGRYREAGYLSVIGIGDSILDGSGDRVSTLATISGFGFFNRAAVDEQGENAIAMFNLTRHGAVSRVWENAERQLQFLPLANVVVEEFGTNDIGSRGTGNVAELKLRLEEIWQIARKAGVQKVLRTSLLPRTVSTDAYRSAENQSPNEGWGGGGKRDEVNAFFAEALINGSLDVLVPTLAGVADPEDDHLWRTDGSAQLLTSDGTHLNAYGNSVLAPILREALLALEVDMEMDSYETWSGRLDWQGQDASPSADPNGDGLSNLGAYAYDLDPLSQVQASDLPSLSYDVDGDEGPWLTISYRHNVSAGDVSYILKVTDALTEGWKTLFVNGIDVVCETLEANSEGDGHVQVKRVRMKISAEDVQKFIGVDVRM
ncbi:SGNH/GDSL hydrolase family protein [Kiritimatiellota bacterium B12222]|nr:SGNH/GDSL hydrolase family protein [Kiritimatiellota bacterium B12222]